MGLRVGHWVATYSPHTDIVITNGYELKRQGTHCGLRGYVIEDKDSLTRVDILVKWGR